MPRHTNHPKFLVGWREWIALPDLGVPAIKAKLDTGARTSALHAFDVEPYTENGGEFVRFSVHPVQGRDDIALPCSAPLLDRRKVRSSTGHRQRRYVILTSVALAGYRWQMELTLTNRDEMKFRMLLGRTAMAGHLLVDPQKSFQAGTFNTRTIYGYK